MLLLSPVSRSVRWWTFCCSELEILSSFKVYIWAQTSPWKSLPVMTAQWKCIDLFSSGNINMTHWQLSPALCNVWPALRQKYLTSALLLSLYFSLSLSFSGRHSFILHAADHSSSSLSSPILLLFLSSACSSPVPLSSLCTAVECIWVLVGSPARTASQIPGLEALHPGCRTHATRHHRQKGGGNWVQYFKEPPGCAIFLS